MEAKDGGTGFDFVGTYTAIKPYELIEYTMGGEDVRKVKTEFIKQDGGYKVVGRPFWRISRIKIFSSTPLSSQIVST